MGWWLQVIGFVLAILGTLSGLVGFILSPEQTIVQSLRVFFSQTQSIKVLPPSLGGKDFLDLDNVARLKLHVPYSINGATLLLDVVVTRQPSNKRGDTNIEGIQTYDQSSGTIYSFDVSKNKRHEMVIGGRTFVVTLLQINRLEISSVANPLEYVFGISEK